MTVLGGPPPSISTRFSDLSRLVLALGVSGDGGSGVWNVHLLGPITRGVLCTTDMGVGCDCSGNRNVRPTPQLSVKTGVGGVEGGVRGRVWRRRGGG